MKKLRMFSISIITIILTSLILNTGLSVMACTDNGSYSDTKINSDYRYPEFSCIPFAYAEWRETNGQRYLNIIASDYYELGKKEGEYLKTEIIYMDFILKNLIISYNLSLPMILYYVGLYEIPEDFKQESLGMAEKTGLTYEEIILQRVFLDLYYGILQPSIIGIDLPKLAGCTAIAVKNSKRNSVIGQNIDFGYAFKPTLAWVKYKIFGRQTVFSLRMGASELPIGKSRIVSALVTLVQTWKIHQFGIPTGIKSRIAFETARNSQKFLEIMTTTYCCSWNYIISDIRGTTFGIETIIGTTITEELEKNDYGIRTNTYVSDELKQYLLNPAFSMNRQKKAVELTLEKIQNRKVKIEDILEILSYNDGSDSSICRYPDPNDPTLTLTEAFFCTSGIRNGYFGIGNAKDNSWGRIPI